MKVTVKEIIAALLGDEHNGPMSRLAIVEWLEAHGIEQPSGEPVAYQRKFHGKDAGIFANTEGLREEMTTEPFASEYEYIPLYAAAEVKP